MDKTELEVVSLSERKFTVDISDEACLPFGFRHGDVVIRPDHKEAMIMGVAPDSFPAPLPREKVLWMAVASDGGKVSVWSGERTDLRKKGFRLKEPAVASC